MHNGRKLAVRVAVAVTVVTLSPAAIAETSVKPYVVPVGNEYQVRALFSVDDRVPETSNPAQQYRMVGIPDGLGAHFNGDGTSSLFMNHELGSSVTSEPVVGGPAYRGAFVSKWTLDGDGDPVSGERAYDDVYVEDTLVGPAPDATNSTRAFARFCSGFMAGPDQGFDRHVYLTNEESAGSDTFDGKGGVSVAIYDNELHVLPEMGHFSKENTVVQAAPGNRTVVVPLEDGPEGPDSQLYMFVGKKDHSKGATVLQRNGLVDGTLYVFRSTTAGATTEADFQAGAIRGEWVALPGADTMTAAELEAASDAAGAFGFVRIEDGAFNPNNNNELFFDTTGGAAGNQLGRLYSLRLGSGNPLKEAALTIVYNADHVIASGGDIAVSPDNLEASGDHLMIQEDGTSQSRQVMASKGRDGSIWRFDLLDHTTPTSVGVDGSSATRVVELDPPGRDGKPVGPGVWESSGIIDTSALFGAGSWLADVQAHPPTTPPSPGTVEDGQLFLMTPAG